MTILTIGYSVNSGLAMAYRYNSILATNHICIRCIHMLIGRDGLGVGVRLWIIVYRVFHDWSGNAESCRAGDVISAVSGESSLYPVLTSVYYSVVLFWSRIAELIEGTLKNVFPLFIDFRSYCHSTLLCLNREHCSTGLSGKPCRAYWRQAVWIFMRSSMDYMACSQARLLWSLVAKTRTNKSPLLYVSLPHSRPHGQDALYSRNIKLQKM